MSQNKLFLFTRPDGSIGEVSAATRAIAVEYVTSGDWSEWGDRDVVAAQVAATVREG